MDIFDVLTLIGGLSLFLFGMNLMGDALERSAGSKLEMMIGKLTTGKLAGLLTGLGVTAIIQSSSATTVMVVGFVNSKLMTLKQAIHVIVGVRRYIYEIIYNLCDNAIRYNIENGRVIISINNESGRAMFSITDTGIGIALEHQNRIFERFYRVDKSHSKETGGTGLGLSIVKHAVQYHGGKMIVDSEIGKGTTIKIIFQ